MLKILHIADIHLGLPLKNKRQTVREKITNSHLSSFQKAIDFAIEKEVDLFLIAGDLFETAFPSPRLVRQVQNKLSNLKNHGITTVYTTGNHDHKNLLTDIHTIDSPVQTNISGLSRTGHAFLVCGIGHSTTSEQKNLIRKLAPKTENQYTIGIAHANVIGAKTTEDKKNYAPCTLSDIENLGYDYFALGHIHIRQMLSDRIAYSGSLQFTDRTEFGNRGGIYLELDGLGISHEIVDFSEIRSEEVSIEIPENLNDNQTLDYLKDYLTEKLPEKLDFPNTYLSLQLNGNGLSKEFLEESLLDELEILDLKLTIKEIRHYNLSDNTIISKVMKKIESLEIPVEEQELLKTMAIKRMVKNEN